MAIIYDVFTSTNSTEDIDDTEESSASTNSISCDDTTSFTNSFLNSTKHIHNTTPLTSNQAKTTEINEFMEFQEYKSLQNLMSALFKFFIALNQNSVINKQRDTLKSNHLINLKSQKIDRNVTKPVLTRRKFMKKNNPKYTNKSESVKKPKDCKNIKEKIWLPNCNSKCVRKLKQVLYVCLILIFLYLIFMFSHAVSLNKNQIHENNDTFTFAVVELEKERLDNNKTLQVLTEYLQRDTSLLKLVVPIGNTSVGKSYIMDIAERTFYKRSDNSLHPNISALDNLRIENITNVINIMEMFQKIHANDQQITVLAFFKIIDDSPRTMNIIRTVKDIFMNSGFIKILPYKNKEILEKYMIIVAELFKHPLIFKPMYKQHLIKDNCNCKKADYCQT